MRVELIEEDLERKRALEAWDEEIDLEERRVVLRRRGVGFTTLFH